MCGSACVYIPLSLSHNMHTHAHSRTLPPRPVRRGASHGDVALGARPTSALRLAWPAAPSTTARNAVSSLCRCVEHAL